MSTEREESHLDKKKRNNNTRTTDSYEPPTASEPCALFIWPTAYSRTYTHTHTHTPFSNAIGGFEKHNTHFSYPPSAKTAATIKIKKKRKERKGLVA